MSDAARQALLRERVAPALAETARLARSPVALTDLLPNELRLRELLVEVVRAHEGINATGLRTEELEAVEPLPGGGISAQAPMAFCPESALIVHAPIMLGRVHALAQRLLPADCLPVAFERVRIRRPVTTDLTLIIAPVATAPANAVLSGRLLDSDGNTWHFSGRPLDNRPVERWVDNREVAALFDITADPAAPVRAFRVTATETATAPLAAAEAVQVLLEALIRSVVIHRNRDGRGILLAGIRRIAWPLELAQRLTAGGMAEVRTEPGKRLRADAPWHRLSVTHSGEFGEGAFDYVEAHTPLTPLFA